MHSLQADITTSIFSTLSENAEYIALNGRRAAVRIILVAASQVVGAGGYVEIRPTINALASEITKPLINGAFAINGEVWIIDRPPELRDGVWVCVVRKS